MAKDNSGMVRSIVVGVITTLLATYLIAEFGLDKGTGSNTSEGDAFINSDADALKQRNAELERKIKELTDSRELQSKQEKMQNDLDANSIDSFWDEEPAQSSEGFTGSSQISGMWSDPVSGASYHIQQTGRNFTIQEYSFGVVSASGRGSFGGKTGSFSYVTLFGTNGRGTLELGDNGNHLHLSFQDLVTGASLSTTIYR